MAVLTGMTDGSDVLFFGNVGHRRAELAAALRGVRCSAFPRPGAPETAQLSSMC